MCVCGNQRSRVIQRDPAALNLIWATESYHDRFIMLSGNSGPQLGRKTVVKRDLHVQIASFSLAGALFFLAKVRRRNLILSRLKTTGSCKRCTGTQNGPLPRNCSMAASLFPRNANVSLPTAGRGSTGSTGGGLRVESHPPREIQDIRGS